ncbi:helix-turn-helix domain-containing protein [Dechloromonas denitrificans]|uniref:helix-turn-helix domain-containing protein n=1 Tax=Dechloromonas denitrificans TaxID=281362 RepID=UPI0039B0FCB7|nr:helix-turn-helix domain-containing protein [Dechloromonas denitrificans]
MFLTNYLMKTLDLTAAAALLHMSEDALMRKTRAGIIPGCKPGRQWVFIEADLIEWMRAQYSQTSKTMPKHWSPTSAGRSGTSTSATNDAKLSDLLKQVSRNRPGRCRTA